MVCARPSGGRERGAARPSQACSSGVTTFPEPPAPNRPLDRPLAFLSVRGNRHPPRPLTLRISEGLRPEGLRP
jgi:hypothetical protein